MHKALVDAGKMLYCCGYRLRKYLFTLNEEILQKISKHVVQKISIKFHYFVKGAKHQ